MQTIQTNMARFCHSIIHEIQILHGKKLSIVSYIIFDLMYIACEVGNIVNIVKKIFTDISLIHDFF